MNPVNRILVLGGGTAGFLAAITLKMKVPGVDVEVVRSRYIGIIGVGEGTTVSVPNFLHGYLNIDPMAFHRAVRPTFKLGIKFFWGPRKQFYYTFRPQFDTQYTNLPRPTGFYCDEDAEYANVNAALMAHDKAFMRLPDGSPGVRNDIAYHMENADFAGFLEAEAQRVGVRITDDTVGEVSQDERGIAALHCRSGTVRSADLYVDCSGFVSQLLGKTLQEPFISFKSSLFCDRAVVGGWQRRPDEPVKPYTTAETMNSGWAWRIDHEHRINRGYVYSSDFISDEEAEREYRAKNPKVDTTRVVKYVSGRYERGWVKNVVAIGNSSGFVEPLESTSIAVICEESHAVAGSLAACDRRPGPMMPVMFNKWLARTWSDIRRFLAIHYKFNTRLDTPFWRACRADTDIVDAREFVDFYTEYGPSGVWKDHLIHGRDAFAFEGYLALMVGQKVPYRKTFEISEQERRTFAAIQQANQAEGMRGLDMNETFAVIHSPRWNPRPGFYRYP